ncbi:ATP-binding protein [Actinomadura flavalba]|uniref:ATP-binding protein n=1 Tax=Actinomadura flavalba TaxID=1120938 RepID=UPI000374608B|nr:ATP-binding protein [Actinomadura flavalba]
MSVAGELLRLDLRDQEEIYEVRRASRELCAAVRLDPQDQVRLPTALSEITRDLVAHLGVVRVTFLLIRSPRAGLTVELALDAEPGDVPSAGLRAAERLLGGVEERTGPGGTVLRLHRDLPAGVDPPSPREAADLRHRFSVRVSSTAADELRVQNAELIDALDDVRRQREELRSLNAELEETNRGVLALYSQLSQELEETNRGVVALYAELDDKSAQLREAAEAKNRFWASISHELRTPVNSVIGLTRLLLDAAAEPLSAEQRHQVGLIADSGETMLSLVNELLDLAKAERGALVAQIRTVPVTHVVTALTEQLVPQAAQAGIALRTELPAEPVELATDEVMLTRILRNVVGNAIRFTREGEVSVEVRAEGDDLLFTVADTGVGIPAEFHRRVFEEFFQVPGTSGGTGLGLPYARRLAELLGGGLDLHSEAGQGTRVTLRLPAGEVPRLGHVLIVDDEDARRAQLRGLLGDAADRVSEAYSAPSALEAVAADPPDLILLDLNMPGGDGLDVLGRIGPDVPVVLVTALDVALLTDSRLARAGATVDKAVLDRPVLFDAVRRAREAVR